MRWRAEDENAEGRRRMRRVMLLRIFITSDDLRAFLEGRMVVLVDFEEQKDKGEGKWLCN